VSKLIRIGTRDSQLALWQANTVKKKLEKLGYQTQLVPVKSTGDLILDKPLYELGITGVFTKTLDVAMLNGQVDIAVHSMKDVPTLLPQGIVQTAVLERGNASDILVTNGPYDLTKHCTIATGSLRRKAQWLKKYPHHSVVGLRGNVNTRLQKLADSDWQGAIFAKAGLKRLNIKPTEIINLDNWMIPAPAQGAMVIVAMQNDKYSIDATTQLNHKETAICTQIEREFLRVLEGGCSAPIGAYVEIIKNHVVFKGNLLLLDGSDGFEESRMIPLNSAKDLGSRIAKQVLANGGKELMEEIKKSL